MNAIKMTDADTRPITPLVYDDDLAALLKVSTRTVHRLASAGKIPGRFRVGRSTRWIR